VIGCGHNELTNLLLLHCSIFCSLWQLVREWIGISSVDPQYTLDHFIQFAYSSEDFISQRLFLQLI